MSEKTAVIVDDEVTFVMDVRQDSFSNPHKIVAVADCEGVSRETMLANNFSGSSMRVKLQTKLRKKSESELKALAENGYTTTWSEINAQEVVSAKDLMARLTKAEFIKTIVDEYGLEEEVAETMYNKKHGILTEEVTE